MTLFTLARREHTGELALTSEMGMFAIAVRRGGIVAATCPRYGELAVRVATAGAFLTPAGAPEATRRTGAQPARDPVEVIAEIERLAPERVHKLRRRVIAQAAARTFGVDSGQFSVSSETSIQGLSGLPIDIRAVVYLAAKTVLAPARIAAVLQPYGDKFVLVPEAGDSLARFGFTETERPLLEALAGGAGLVDLALAFPAVDARVVHGLVYALVTCLACVPTTSAEHFFARGTPMQSVRESTGAHAAVPPEPPPPPTARASASGTMPAMRATTPPFGARPTTVPPEAHPALEPRTGHSTVAPRPTGHSTVAPRPTAPPPIAASRTTAPPPIAASRTTTPPASRTTTPPASRTTTPPASRTTAPPPAAPVDPPTVTPPRVVALKSTTPPGPYAGRAAGSDSGLRSIPQRPTTAPPPSRPTTAPPPSRTSTPTPSASRTTTPRSGPVVVPEPSPRRPHMGTTTPTMAFKRGQAALERGDLESALEELKQATELDPSSADYAMLHAWAQFAAADDKAAIADRVRSTLQKAIIRSTQPEVAQFYLGRVERMLGREKEALRHFRAVIDADPKHREAAAEIRVLEQRLKR